MNNIDKAYTDLLQDILDNGVTKQDRTGTGTKSVFGRQIRHKMSEGFPLLTTKKIHWKSIVTELLWFLRGDTNIKYLVDNGCHIWDGDCYSSYFNKWKPIGEGPIYINPLTKEEFINKIKTDDEFAKTWGELGPIYGKQWRNWNGESSYYVKPATYNLDYTLQTPKQKVEYTIKGIDQIANSIHLLKTDPDSRRNKVSAWNVGELSEMVLPPCHTDFQFYTRELTWEERWELAKKYGYIKGDIEIPTEDSMYMGLSERETLNSMWNDSVVGTNLPTRAISLMWNQRSVDTFLGLPFNIASYGLLLTMIADEVNMIPDELIGNLGDVHLYTNHIEQAKEQISRTLFELPKVSVRDGIHCSSINDAILENYQSHPAIKASLSN